VVRNPRLRFTVDKIKQGMLAETQRMKIRQYRRRSDVMEAQRLKDNDLIISSFGSHPLELKRGANGSTSMSLTEQLQGNGAETVNENMPGQTAYRRWMPAKF